MEPGGGGRRGLAAEIPPGLSIEEMTFTRDEAAESCQAVRKRLKAPRLTRVFVLRALVWLNKNKEQ